MQRRDSSLIDDYNIEASFQMGDAGSHPCVPGTGDLLPHHGDHGDHKVEKEGVQKIGAHLTRHQGIREQVVVKQVIQFSDCQIP